MRDVKLLFKMNKTLLVLKTEMLHLLEYGKEVLLIVLLLLKTGEEMLFSLLKTSEEVFSVFEDSRGGVLALFLVAED